VASRPDDDTLLLLISAVAFLIALIWLAIKNHV